MSALLTPIRGTKSGLRFKTTSAVWIALICSFTLAPTVVRSEEARDDRLHFSGYGEFHYNNPRVESRVNSDAESEADVHRLVLGWTYEFTSKIRLEAEVDFEHAAGEIEVEEALIEYDLAPSISVRAGSLLMPVGPLNEIHEPVLYYSVERPYVETYVIPTSWQEIGAGVVGRAAKGSLSYRGYVVTGLDARSFTTLEGIREGRGHGSETPAENLTGVARLEYAWSSGLGVGVSGYLGRADQGDSALGSVRVGITGADARYRRHGWDLRLTLYRVSLDGAERVSLANGETIGRSMTGWYGEVAYDLLRRDAGASRRRSLVIFVRHEDLDTNDAVPAAFPRDPAAERRVISGGMSYFPIEKVAFKADFEHWEDGADAQLNRFNLGTAFLF